MLRFFRIIFGIILVPIPFLMASWIFLHTAKKGDSYTEVLNLAWFMISGQWELLPE